jgi:hypothetical protein
MKIIRYPQRSEGRIQLRKSAKNGRGRRGAGKERNDEFMATDQKIWFIVRGKGVNRSVFRIFRVFSKNIGAVGKMKGYFVINICGILMQDFRMGIDGISAGR